MSTQDTTTIHEEKSKKKTGMGSTANPGDDKLQENSKERLDETLDNASEESFPGSDPVSVKITK